MGQWVGKDQPLIMRMNGSHELTLRKGLKPDDKAEPTITQILETFYPNC